MSRVPDSVATRLAELLPQPGTDLHYAQLYLPAPLKASLGLIEALRGEIARVPVTCSNPETATLKLAWWREELERLATGTSRHTLTQALQPLQLVEPALVPAALALVDGVAGSLQITRYATRAERLAAFDASHGPLWEFANARCMTLDRSAADQARRLGSLVELAYALRDTRRQIAAGAALLTQETVALVEVAHGAGELADGDWYAKVIALDIDDTLAQLRATLAGLPARRALRPLATLSRLIAATLVEVQADGNRVWERRVELTPLRKLWLAWRERCGL